MSWEFCIAVISTIGNFMWMINDLNKRRPVWVALDFIGGACGLVWLIHLVRGAA